MRHPPLLAALRRLADQVLEAPDLDSLAQLLTRLLPQVLDIPEATLLLWNRKLDSFEAITPGKTQHKRLQPGGEEVQTPEARFLLTDGSVLETPGGSGEGVLIPLMARSGLVGMLVLGGRRKRRRVPFSSSEAKAVSAVAARAALSLENHLYHAEVIDSERMAALGTMAGMLAHDFRGPMTVIRGHAELLLAGNALPEQVRTSAHTMMAMVDRLERMTRETLDFARGGGRLAARPYSVRELVAEIVDGLKEEMPSLEILPDVDLPGAILAVDVDKLRRVVSNIASNAREAMGGAGRLAVQARVESPPAADNSPARLVLVLADEGPGVPSDIRDRIFEPFVTRGKKGGTGLGLAVARRFVEDHGGTLELLAEGPGARFRIDVPLAVSKQPRRDEA